MDSAFISLIVVVAMIFILARCDMHRALDRPPSATAARSSPTEGSP